MREESAGKRRQSERRSVQSFEVLEVLEVEVLDLLGTAVADSGQGIPYTAVAAAELGILGAALGLGSR